MVLDCIEYGLPPIIAILNAMTIANKAWRTVVTMISNCWMEMSFLIVLQLSACVYGVSSDPDIARPKKMTTTLTMHSYSHVERIDVIARKSSKLLSRFGSWQRDFYGPQYAIQRLDSAR
ncbi:hypothetical protein HHI36_018334 [Cryptolaemus montrouzieri]|uniref:Uncharacterized protein n=1 Tax=Cryptolaemus montrouzieri TaxID=559131 RepID=A0ABD2P024_9CUCU